MGRKNKSQKEIEEGLGALIILGILGVVVNAVSFVFEKIKEGYHFLELLVTQKPELPIIAGMVFVIIFILRFTGERKRKIRLEDEEREQKEIDRIEREKYFEKLNHVRISDERKDYIIGKDDYKRGNRKENEYRKKYVLRLLGLYGNKCAKCARVGNGFDLDHFVFSKNEGGNFALLHKDGYWVNNAIPLCQTCNRSKGDRSYKDFFSEDEILSLFEKNKDMTLILNTEK